MKTIKYFLALIFIISFSNTYAQVYAKWTGQTDSKWTEASNWDGGMVPQSTLDSAVFDTGGIIIIDSVPFNLNIQGIRISPNNTGTDSPTELHINSFETGTSNVQLMGLLIGDGCAIRYSETIDISITEKVFLNQAEIETPKAGITLIGGCNTDVIIAGSLTASSVANQGNVNLYGDLNLHCQFINAGVLNIGDGTVIVHEQFYTNENLNGTGNSTLKLSSTASYISELPTLILGTLINESGIVISIGSSLSIEKLLKLVSGNLAIPPSGSLYLNGEFICENGKIEGGTTSNLDIGTSANSGTVMTLKFEPGRDSIGNFNVQRSGVVVDVQSHLVITNLNLGDSKLKFNYHTLTLEFSPSTALDTKSAYIITGPEGAVIAPVKSGTQFSIPIGTERFFAPVTILSGSDTDFKVNVAEHVFSEGRTGYILSPDELVNLTWDVTTADAALNYDVDFNWDILAQGQDFNDANSYVAHYNGVEWELLTNATDAIQTPTATGVNIVSLANIPRLGLFTVGSQINQPPIAEDSIFTIPEHSPNGTFVGMLNVSDANIGQILNVNPQPNEYLDAFTASNDSVFVFNSEYLEFSDIPIFYYTLDACDNGLPVLCTQFNVTIHLEEILSDLQATNYISPNGDGMNDVWMVRGANIETMEVFIFNNAGSIVYQSENYQNDWNGTYNGTNLAPGVYYYLIRTANGQQRGTITLAR